MGVTSFVDLSAIGFVTDLFEILDQLAAFAAYRQPLVAPRVPKISIDRIDPAPNRRIGTRHKHFTF